MRNPSRTWLEQALLIAERGREILNLGGPGRRAHSAESLCRRLLAQRGEASGIALAGEVVGRLSRMDGIETAAFIRLLGAGFAPDPTRVDGAVDRWRATRDQGSLQALFWATEPPRQELFRRLNVAPGGTQAIVDLRAALLDLLPAEPDLEPVEKDLGHLLGSWFNRGFLQLEQISWQTSAAVLERLIRYEAVHEMNGWEDLQRRLAGDRRCFAFFHPALPDQPLIFVEVALTRGLATAIGPLLAPGRAIAEPGAADTAIFYSISNTQRGLRGVSFGSFLIKQVVSELAAELPHLKRFATLSPLPEMAAAVRRHDETPGFTVARLEALAEPDADALRRLAPAEPSPAAAFLALAGRPGEHPEAVRRVLQRVTLAYLVHVRRRGRVSDPVAHFHLSNGARLERIDIDANLSPSGRESFGVMVNYLYEPDRLEENHERYVETGEPPLSRTLAAAARRVEPAWRGPA